MIYLHLKQLNTVQVLADVKDLIPSINAILFQALNFPDQQNNTPLITHNNGFDELYTSMVIHDKLRDYGL